MKNRLEIAREFLREDGVIFVQCDDNEQAYLKVLMDEIFRRENFVATICRIATKRVKGDAKNINKNHDYIHIYAKKIENFQIKHLNKEYNDKSIYEFSDEFVNERGKHLLRPLDNGTLDYTPTLDYIITAPNGNKICAGGDFNDREKRLNGKSNKKDWRFRWSEEKFKFGLENGFIVFKESKGKQRVYFKIYQFVDNDLNLIERTDKVLSVFDEMFNNQGTTEISNVLGKGVFQYPKPEALIKRIIEISTQENDLVMDFFAGSGTTCAVAHKMKRRWIGIEQMDYIESITKERLIKVIEGEQGGISKAVGWNPLSLTDGELPKNEFIYCELMSLNAVFKEQIQALNDESELEQLYKDLQEKAFVDYRVDIKELLKDKEFEALNLDEKKRILHAILDSNMDYVLYGDIKDENLGVSNELVELNRAFFKGGEDE